MLRSRTLVFAVVLLSMWLVGPGVALPGPVVVEEGASHGELRIEPVGVTIDLAPQSRDRLDVVIANGGQQPLELALTVRDVEADDDGAPRPADGGPLPSAAAWLQLPSPTVHLGPQEQALLPLAVSVPAATASGGYVAQVAATSTTTAPQVEVATTVIVRVATATSDVAADLEVVSDAESATVEVTLAAPVGAVVSSTRIAVTSWLRSRTADLALGPTVVLPGIPRTIRQPFDVPALPGGYRVDAVLDIADETIEVTATVWLWQRGVLLAVALGLLLLTAAALVTVRRRRRHAYAASETTQQERT